MTDLSLVPVEALIKELDNRFDALVLSTARGTVDGNAYDMHIKGCQMTCLGLSEMACNKIVCDFEMEPRGGFEQD